tara:strand:- start:26 stop:262 length:237 start_codon:yes stop_codon:yes gene_type:complete
LPKKKKNDLSEIEHLEMVLSEQIRINGCKILILENENEFLKEQLRGNYPYLKYTAKEYRELLTNSKQNKAKNKGQKGC